MSSEAKDRLPGFPLAVTVFWMSIWVRALTEADPTEVAPEKVVVPWPSVWVRALAMETALLKLTLLAFSMVMAPGFWPAPPPISPVKVMLPVAPALRVRVRSEPPAASSVMVELKVMPPEPAEVLMSAEPPRTALPMICTAPLFAPLPVVMLPERVMPPLAVSLTRSMPPGVPSPMEPTAMEPVPASMSTFSTEVPSMLEMLMFPEAELMSRSVPSERATEPFCMVMVVPAVNCTRLPASKVKAPPASRLMPSVS